MKTKTLLNSIAILMAIFTLGYIVSCEPIYEPLPVKSKVLRSSSSISLVKIDNSFNNEAGEIVLEYFVSNNSEEMMLDSAQVVIMIDDNDVFTYDTTSQYITNLDTLEVKKYSSSFVLDSTVKGNITPIFINQKYLKL